MSLQERCPFERNSNCLNAGQSFLRHDSNSYGSTAALIRLRLEDLYEQKQSSRCLLEAGVMRVSTEAVAGCCADELKGAAQQERSALRRRCNTAS